ncbi:hypothetical protein GLOIN_2v1495260 [Rhizophagus clarus]|uniref:Uncharacterized protein n=1 Tax=Rhizophagus clarus TaxID=94130 RepID=A0A8H3L2N8_9GLOM|nr:hypothetical protein GLOIN_2v1495260 [Rhizophagus clarus]
MRFYRYSDCIHKPSCIFSEHELIKKKPIYRSLRKISRTLLGGEHKLLNIDVGANEIGLELMLGYCASIDREKLLKFEAENGELKVVNAEIPDLRRKISEFDAERAELKRRIAEALKMTEEERTRRDAEDAKLKARIEELEFEFRDRITKVEQKQTLNDNSPNSSSNFNSVADQVSTVMHHEKPLVDTSLPEDKELIIT